MSCWSRRAAGPCTASSTTTTAPACAPPSPWREAPLESSRAPLAPSPSPRGAPTCCLPPERHTEASAVSRTRVLPVRYRPILYRLPPYHTFHDTPSASCLKLARTAPPAGARATPLSAVCPAPVRHSGLFPSSSSPRARICPFQLMLALVQPILWWTEPRALPVARCRWPCCQRPPLLPTVTVHLLSSQHTHVSSAFRTAWLALHQEPLDERLIRQVPSHTQRRKQFRQIVDGGRCCRTAAAGAAAGCCSSSAAAALLGRRLHLWARAQGDGHRQGARQWQRYRALSGQGRRWGHPQRHPWGRPLGRGRWCLRRGRHPARRRQGHP